MNPALWFMQHSALVQFRPWDSLLGAWGPTAQAMGPLAWAWAQGNGCSILTSASPNLLDCSDFHLGWLPWWEGSGLSYFDHV